MYIYKNSPLLGEFVLQLKKEKCHVKEETGTMI